MKRYWFKAKRYGWGWYPASWEGWLVTFAAIVAITINAIFVDRAPHSASDVLIGTVFPTILIASLLTLIAYLTGEKPRWRWGGRD